MNGPWIFRPFDFAIIRNYEVTVPDQFGFQLESESVTIAHLTQRHTSVHFWNSPGREALILYAYTP